MGKVIIQKMIPRVAKYFLPLLGEKTGLDLIEQQRKKELRPRLERAGSGDMCDYFLIVVTNKAGTTSYQFPLLLSAAGGKRTASMM